MCYAVLELRNISPVRFFLNVFLHKKVTKLYISKLSLIHVTLTSLSLSSYVSGVLLLALQEPFTTSSEKRGSATTCWSEVRSGDCPCGTACP